MSAVDKPALTPWWEAAQEALGYYEAGPVTPEETRGHWATYAWSQHLAAQAAVLKGGVTAQRAFRVHYLPAVAAFTAAALADGWDCATTTEALNDAEAFTAQTRAWVEAAGINPDHIAPHP